LAANGHMWKGKFGDVQVGMAKIGRGYKGLEPKDGIQRVGAIRQRNHWKFWIQCHRLIIIVVPVSHSCTSLSPKFIFSPILFLFFDQSFKYIFVTLLFIVCLCFSIIPTIRRHLSHPALFHFKLIFVFLLDFCGCQLSIIHFSIHSICVLFHSFII
jgi:hypothetical protein